MEQSVLWALNVPPVCYGPGSVGGAGAFSYLKDRLEKNAPFSHGSPSASTGAAAGL